MDRGCEKLYAYDEWNLEDVLNAQEARDYGEVLTEDVK
jgi:hypothetical protein